MLLPTIYFLTLLIVLLPTGQFIIRVKRIRSQQHQSVKRARTHLGEHVKSLDDIDLKKHLLNG